MLKNVYIFMGPPGAGKGSLSSRCIDELGWKQVSTGNLCRQEVIRQTELGKQIDFIVKSGKLVPDGLIAQMIEQALLDHQMYSDVILDGFPRTTVQAQELDRILSQSPLTNINLYIVVMNVTDDVVIDRLCNRIVCQNEVCQAVYSLKNKKDESCNKCSSPLVKRNDDDETIIKRRLRYYREHEQALLDYYRLKRRLLELSAKASLNEIFEQFGLLLRVV